MKNIRSSKLVCSSCVTLVCSNLFDCVFATLKYGKKKVAKKVAKGQTFSIFLKLNLQAKHGSTYFSWK